MKKSLTLFFSLLLTLASYGQVAGDYLFQRKIATGFTNDWITPLVGSVPYWSTITNIAPTPSTAFGRGAWNMVDAAAFRTYIGAGSGTGDVVGPASSVNNNVPQFNGTTGKLLKDGLGTSLGANGAADSGKLTLFGAQGQLQGSSSTANAVQGIAVDGTGVYGENNSLTQPAGEFINLSGPIAHFHNITATGMVVENDGGLSWTSGTGAQTTADNLPVFGAADPGVVPASGGGTSNFLRADGTFAAPAGTAGITSLTGDVTGTGPGATATTLATVNANVGSFGSATQVGGFTVNAKGLITAASNTTVTPAVGSITGLGTGMATWLATPSSANLRSTVTDETGTGALVFADGAIGAATATTAAQGTNTTQVATTAFVQQDAIVKTFVAAKGDIIGGSANDTPAITSVGTNGQLLMANSANASGLGYAWKTFAQAWIRTSTTISNIPAAITWFTGGTGTTRQQPYSLAGYKQIKIDVFVTTAFGGAGSGVLFRYRTSYSATETDYSEIGVGATDCKAPISTANDWNTSGWVDITAAALTDVYIGAFTINGNGTSDPIVSQVILSLR